MIFSWFFWSCLVDKKSSALTIGSVALTIRSVLWQYDLLLYSSYPQRNRSYCQSNKPNWRSSRSLVNLAQQRKIMKIMIFMIFTWPPPKSWKILKNHDFSWFSGWRLWRSIFSMTSHFPHFSAQNMLKSKNPQKFVTLTTGSVFGSVLIFQDFCFSSFLIWIFFWLESEKSGAIMKIIIFRELLRLGVAKIMKIHGGLFVLNFYRTVSLEGCFCLSSPFCLWSKSTFYFWFLYIPLSAKLKFDMPSLALSLTLSLCKLVQSSSLTCLLWLSLSLPLSLALSLSKAQVWHAFCGSHKHTLSLLIYMYRFLSLYLSIYLFVSFSL